MSLNYIAYYDDVLEKNTCEELIKRFETETENHVLTSMDKHRNFTEINITSSGWNQTQDLLLDKMQIYLQKYRNAFGIDTKLWPTQLGHEMFRMKRYMPNDIDEFKFHADVGDYASAKRFLAYFWYLNDVKEGGETAFYWGNSEKETLKVKPISGRLLIFPPMWTHPHAGLKPISGPKYIIGGYLHYI